MKRDYDKSVTLYDCQNTFEKFVDLKPSLIRSITRHEPDFEQVELATESWNDNVSYGAIATAQFSRHFVRDSSSTFFFFFFPKTRTNETKFYWTLSISFSLCVKNLLLKKKKIANYHFRWTLNRSLKSGLKSKFSLRIIPNSHNSHNHSSIFIYFSFYQFNVNVSIKPIEIQIRNLTKTQQTSSIRKEKRNEKF